VIDDLHGAIPFAWNPDTLNSYSIIYPMKSQQHASLYFAMPALGNQQAMLSIYEFRDGILRSLDTLQGLAYSSQPFMSPDGKTLYFVSNRMDEKEGGGTDIWYFKFIDDQLRGPFSLGGTINTSFNEKNPYLPHPDTLYFSSDMDGGKGGFDILRAIRENAEPEIWSIPEPVEELNSKWNDADFIILNDTAVISRDNPSGEGQLDLYWFKKTSNRTIKTRAIVSVNGKCDSDSTKHLLRPKCSCISYLHIFFIIRIKRCQHDIDTRRTLGSNARCDNQGVQTCIDK